MLCSVAFDSTIGIRHDVPLPSPGGSGPRSWAGVVPEPGSKVIVAWKKSGSRHDVPYIVEFLTAGTAQARDYEPFMTISPEETREALDDLWDNQFVRTGAVRLKMRKAYPGDFLASASSGSDIILDRDVMFTNRSGNEIRLRDSDQTLVSQSLNEFTSNAAGFYRRGLIRRDAMNFLPDLFDLTAETDVQRPYDVDPASLFIQKVPASSPAFDILRTFKLIDENGIRTFDYSVESTLYPYVVLADGQRASYVVQGDASASYAQTDTCYVEDRKELRHVSTGRQSVTAEVDGFQVDLEKELYIEDAHGTIVGNDFKDAPKQYKRVLGMSLYEDVDGSFPHGPTFDPIDHVTDLDTMDAVALARLYRIQSPTNSNQYAFGITKEGKVTLHVPAATKGNDVGRSVDFNAVGMVKMTLGQEPSTGQSLNMKTRGGVKLDLGRNNTGDSVDMVLGGPVRGRIVNDDPGSPAIDVKIGGSTSSSMSGSSFHNVGGSSVKIVGSLDATEAAAIQHNAGPGGYKFQCVGDMGRMVMGKVTETYGLPVTTMYALGSLRTFLAGADVKTMLAGVISRTVAAGAGILDTVGAGNAVTSVATGNCLMSVAAGNLSASVGAGNLSIAAAAGPVSIASSLVASITAGTAAAINAPMTKIGLAVVGGAVAGIPSAPAPHFDYITGLPILGVPTVTVG